MLKRRSTDPWTWLARVGLLLFVLAARLAAAAPGCSTVVVGKKVSLTGEVLLGHNEDNEGRLVVACYRMPRSKHTPGEMIALEEGKAKIPQVAETAAYLWWETIADWKASYSDDFINEWGVAVISDSCWPSKETKGELVEGGIGYGLRRIIVERARTAREGVDIAAGLVDRYGYADSGRTYIIADKNEGWLFEVVMGKHYVARRVADDEVAFIPNWYTIREVDFKDKEQWVVSPDLVSYAVQRGWFVPKVPGDTSDFVFAKAYMSPEMYDTNWKVTQDPRRDYNVLRHKYALEMITGGSFGYGRDYPFAVKLARKMGPEDLMALFRTHYEGKPDYRTTSPANSPHSLATICASETQESLIFQFRENPDFTAVWWTAGRPCTSAYVPWYLGIQRVPEGYGWKDPVEAMASHFKPSEDDLSRNPDRAWWAFMDLQNGLEPRYFGDDKEREAGAYAGRDVLRVQKRWGELEKLWLGRQKAVEAEANALEKKGAEAVREYLTRYTSDQAKKASAAAREMAGVLGSEKGKK
jgi:dipeptidase